MIPVKIEGVRRNFTSSSVFLYSVSLIDETGQRLLIFGIERHEVLPIVATLNNLTLLRQETINLMADTLKLLGCTLEEIYIESHSMLQSLRVSAALAQWGSGARAGDDSAPRRCGGTGSAHGSADLPRR